MLFQFKSIECPHCGTDNTEWDYRMICNSEVPEGRLRTNEVSVIFYVGCNECSETITILRPNQIVNLLNELT